MSLKVGTTSGIYYAAREAELHSAIRKLGYTLTRGASAMELAVDVAHEVTFTQGQEIRHMARKQGVIINLHGDLSVPMEMPERGEWRDSQDRIKKSLRSAIFAGAKYIDFHACLNIWLELITYAGRKLTMSFCDPDGQFISEILYKSKPTREWFIKYKGDHYLNDVLDRDENIRLSTRIRVDSERWEKEETERRMRAALATILNEPVPRAARNTPDGIIIPHVRDLIDEIVDSALIRGVPYRTENPKVEAVIKKTLDELAVVRSEESARLRDRTVDQFLREKLSDPDLKRRRWHSEELRAMVGIVDGYHIMTHYMFYTQDPLWLAMAGQYKDVLQRYGYDTKNPDWLEETWKKAESLNDRDYKEFFYAAASAKYIEGHMRAALNWLNGDFIKKELPQLTKDPKERAELTAVARSLIIGLENPDAREPSHAGLYFLYRPKQIYAAVKTIRRVLKTDKVMMIADFEHLATQGIDAILEARDFIAKTPDFGALTISCHSNHPNPLHAHYPLELGDVVLYELLYHLRVTGFGRDREAYMIFERGGGQDPFVHSVDSLRLMAEFLLKDPPVPVDDLPLEFFGMKGLTGGDIQRQMQIVRDKAFEPMKDLLTIPEEDFTLLSQTAIRGGKRPEVWKRGEFR
ncbi:MAG: hypothetical protein HY520_01780 [Candidatus Aenigmarchaeota archaeon]|nr:hypothetical protein [Candidatus Aenigmarchaeota archaeon]